MQIEPEQSSSASIEGFQISPQQKHILLLNHDISKYSIQIAIQFEGYLTKESIKSATSHVMRQQEIFHTCFLHTAGMEVPLQVISDRQELSWQEADISDLDNEAQKAAINRLFKQQLNCIADVEHGSLISFYLAKIAPDLQVLLVTAHALCADYITLCDVAHSIYQSVAQENDVSADQVQYADVSAWLNEMLESDETSEGRLYWDKKLQQPLPFPSLPNRTLAHASQTFAPCSVADITLSAELMTHIDAIAKKHASSMEAFLLTCWQILLSRVTSGENNVIGVACDGRKYEELKEAYGPLTKYVPFMCQVDESARFVDVLQQAKDTLQSIYAMQEFFRFDQLKLEQELKKSEPFIPLAFEYVIAPTFSSASQQVSASITQVVNRFDRFELKLSCIRTDTHLVLQFAYDDSMFSASECDLMAQRFQKMLSTVIAHPEIGISKLDGLSEIEYQYQLKDWNGTALDFQEQTLLHKLFESQVERTPNDTAIIYENVQITFSELNSRANQLAHRLRGLGVERESVVAICIEQSIEMIVGILGTLKAGHAFLPLDLGNPTSRLNAMLEDARVSLILTQQHLRERFQTYAGKIIEIDTDSEIAAASQENPHCEAHADNLAYVIYTSGSTGIPKGVMITHRAICNRLAWGQHTYPLTAEDTVLQSAAFGFDFAVWEIFAPLSFGACLVLEASGRSQDSKYLQELIIKHHITFIHFIPVVLRLFLQEKGLENGHSLKHVFCGGDILFTTDQTLFFNSLNAQLHNQYGPTEATIDVTHWLCKQEEQGSTVPIGKPIANLQVYILDQYQRIVPVGMPGELYIAGLGLARGYLNHPDLTAERFIPDPFSTIPGARLYRTGDIVRYRQDGILEFISRLDTQIKIRGFRIELNEIRYALQQHQATQDIIVRPYDTAIGDKKIAAYMVLKPEQKETITVSDWHRFLQERLPEYMIPSAFIPLREFPRTPGGKVDYQALPVPDHTRPELADRYTAPRTPIEEELVSIWSNILAIDHIGVQDNFFELGGHSLLAMQIISRVRNIFQVEVPLLALFERPTVEGQAALIVGHETKPGQAEKVALLLQRVRSMSADDVNSALLKKGKGETRNHGD